MVGSEESDNDSRGESLGAPYALVHCGRSCSRGGGAARTIKVPDHKRRCVAVPRRFPSRARCICPPLLHGGDPLMM